MILGAILTLSLVDFVLTVTENEFIVDYFSRKRAPNVVGFSCNSAQDDLQLMKYLSQRGMSATIKKLTFETEIHDLACTTTNGLGIFIDIRCYDLIDVTSIFSQASVNRMFDKLRCWLILSSTLDGLWDIVDDRTFGLSTDFVVAVPLDADSFQLHDLYNIFKNRGEKLRISFLGSWLKGEGLNISLKANKVQRRSNMQNITLKASFYKSSHKPECMGYEEYFQDRTNGTLDGFSKYGFNILRHLSNIYNFTLKAIESSTWQPGDVVGPVALDVWNDIADFTGTGLVITYKRAEIVKSLHQAWPSRTCFIFRSPQPKNIKVQEILRPFANKIWYLMVIVLVATVPIMMIIIRMEERGSFMDSISHSFLIVIGALCQQCAKTEMKRLSTRLTFLSISIYSYLIYSYYSSSVVYARLDEPIFKINDSLNQMSKLKLKLGSEWFAFADFFIRGNDREHEAFFNNYWDKIPKDKKFISPEDGIRLVREGGFAYHTHPEVGYPLIEKIYTNREVCELMEVHAMYRDAQSYFGTSINSSLEEIWRIGLTKISEVGLRNHQILTWTFRKPVCDPNILSTSSVDMDEFAPHLILLAIGMMISSVLCIVEMVVETYDRDGGIVLIKILERLSRRDLLIGERSFKGCENV